MNWHDLHFLRPQWLLALAPLALLMWRLWRTTGAHTPWAALCDARLLRHLLVDGEGGVRRSPLVLLASAWLLAVLALAGPTWSRWPAPVYRAQAARALVLDLSRSMDATDVQPSRLSAARY